MISNFRIVEFWNIDFHILNLNKKEGENDEKVFHGLFVGFVRG